MSASKVLQSEEWAEAARSLMWYLARPLLGILVDGDKNLTFCAALLGITYADNNRRKRGNDK